MGNKTLLLHHKQEVLFLHIDINKQKYQKLTIHTSTEIMSHDSNTNTCRSHIQSVINTEHSKLLKNSNISSRNLSPFLPYDIP